MVSRAELGRHGCSHITRPALHYTRAPPTPTFVTPPSLDRPRFFCLCLFPAASTLFWSLLFLFLIFVLTKIPSPPLIIAILLAGRLFNLLPPSLQPNSPSQPGSDENAWDILDTPRLSDDVFKKLRRMVVVIIPCRCYPQTVVNHQCNCLQNCPQLLQHLHLMQLLQIPQFPFKQNFSTSTLVSTLTTTGKQQHHHNDQRLM